MARAVSKVRKAKAKPKTKNKKQTKAKTTKIKTTKIKTTKTKKARIRRAAAAPARPTRELCVDFASLTVNTHYVTLVRTVGRYDFKFSLLSGAPPKLVIKETAGEKGLQFPASGMGVDLPGSASKVTMRVGAWRGPFTIKAYDRGGSTVGSADVNLRNAFGNVTIASASRNIATLAFVGGADEGMLVTLCISP
jgi:hypothetical protein